MKMYRPRKIQLNRRLAINNWNVKVYTITHQSRFESAVTLQSAIARLPGWLEKSRATGFETHGVAFLIVHEGLDGVWTLINWWMCDELLQSLTFFTSYKTPTEFQPFPQEGFAACVWELEVIVFERSMWIEHILKKADTPSFDQYLQASLNIEA
ncbi:MAG TPA: hypothetical protein PKE58_14810 [Acidobacteriota bacterium]|nr:hypothetical protein [Acidobacteriota bacterium]